VTSLRVTDLYKSYGPQAVLRGLDLTVDAGSFTSILGPSGSGKTTLLRVLAGFERADRGVLRLNDEVIDDGTRYVMPDRRRIGYVPQDGSLFPHLSVEQNVGFGLPRRERRGKRVAGLLEMVGLGGLGRRYPHQLSGGQQQRVALARALAVEPAFVLLDEPFSSLDASLRATVRQDVRRVLREAGATVLLVTHDQDEALSLADHVAVITDGRIGQCDTPQGLYAHPLNPELALRFGATNFVHGVARGAVIETPLGLLPLENGSESDDTRTDGTALLVLVRPEQIVFSAKLDDAHATARVVDAEFYGHDAVIRLRAGWDDSTILVARTSEASRLPSEGVEVALSVRGRVVAWADEAAPIGAGPKYSVRPTGNDTSSLCC